MVIVHSLLVNPRSFRIVRRVGRFDAWPSSTARVPSLNVLRVYLTIAGHRSTHITLENDTHVTPEYHAHITREDDTTHITPEHDTHAHHTRTTHTHITREYDTHVRYTEMWHAHIKLEYDTRKHLGGRCWIRIAPANARHMNHKK